MNSSGDLEPNRTKNYPVWLSLNLHYFVTRNFLFYHKHGFNNL